MEGWSSLLVSSCRLRELLMRKTYLSLTIGYAGDRGYGCCLQVFVIVWSQLRRQSWSSETTQKDKSGLYIDKMSVNYSS